MWIGEVDFPNKLIEAQESGELVIFAGAGVSMASPSNLPSFVGLAEQIGGEILTKYQKEHIDEYLGILSKQGVEVHSRALDILNNPESKPTSLHYDIVSLFKSSDSLRIVTTNLDRHFTCASLEVFPKCETYYAPALPLGRDFNGLVYLHGAVEKHNSSHILTDKDFGEAYLTDGWATRFLRELFTRYTVLFIGYSHSDPIMKYLSRGLPLQSKRYALTDSNKLDDWFHWGIEPIQYRLKRSKANKYSVLYQAIYKWAKRSNMGTLEHEVRIKNIVESSSLLDKEESDYINNALSKIVTTRFFTRHAKSIEWLYWAKEQPTFRNLFTVQQKSDDIAIALSQWFAECYAFYYPGESLELVQQLGSNLSPVLWNNIAWELGKTKLPDPQWLSKWMVLLVETATTDSRTDNLESLFGELRHPDDALTAILLFKFLTTPQMKLEKFISFTDQDKKDIDVEVIIKTDFHWLNEAWVKLFKPNLSEYAAYLEPIITSHFTQANLILHAMGKANSEYDSVSAWRSAIEAHELDRHPGHFDILINIGRALVEFLLDQDVNKGKRVINNWISSDVLILKRLALHGIVESKFMTPDQKILQILENGFLFNSGMKHEVFRLLSLTYCRCTDKIKRRLLKTAMEYTQKIDNNELRYYAVFELLEWLNRCAPECPSVKKYLDKILALHPEFKPREHPDLNRNCEYGVFDITSPFTIEQVLELNPKEILEFLTNFKEKNWRGHSKEGLLNIITAAVSQDFEWGWKIVLALIEKGEWNNELWKRIDSGWKQEGLKDQSQWELVLELFIKYPQLYWMETRITDLLEDIVKIDVDKALPLFPKAEELASILFEHSQLQERPIVVGKDGWVFKALNTIGGSLALFFLNMLAKRRQIETSWIGIPDEYKMFMQDIVERNDSTSQMAKLVFASQIHFLFSLDSEWTKHFILPLYDFKRDKEQAIKSWHGFAYWGRWNEGFLPQLLLNVIDIFNEIGIQPKDVKEGISRFLANVALFYSENPLQSKWLIPFFKQADLESKTMWATEIGRQLDSINSSAIEGLWNTWVKSYWEYRNYGQPTILDDSEIEQMIYWAVPLQPVFLEVVNLICAKPAPQKMNLRRFLHRLIQMNIINFYPLEVARLIRHILNGAEQQIWGNDIEKIIDSLIESPACKHILKEICDRLAELNFKNALALSKRVDNMPDPDIE